MDQVTHNKGASVPDAEAIPDGRSLAEWRQQRGIDTSAQIRTVKLAHMRYQHPDLAAISVFLRDFGMQIAKETDDVVYFRGYGVDQYVYYVQKGPKKFLGGTFEVETYNDLVNASKLAGATPIQSLADAPGGGSLVTLHDPEGQPINLMFGQTPRQADDPPERLVLNFETEKPRERKFQRFEPGPAAVHKVRVPYSTNRGCLLTM